MLDHTEDKNYSTLYSISRDVDFPSFVKEAEVRDHSELKDLDNKAFADRQNRRYPIDTPADTWLSYCYFMKNASDLTEPENIRIHMNIVDASELWNIDLPEFNTEDEINKEAEEQTYIQYTEDIKTPVNTAEDIQKLASDIIDNWRKYTYEIRHSVAKQLLKTASAKKWNIDNKTKNLLEKSAGMGFSTLDRVKNVINFRKYLIRDAEIKKGLDKLQKKAEENAVMDSFISPEVTEKIAGFIDAVDRMAVLYHPSLNSAENDLVQVTVSNRKNLQKHAVILPNNHIVSKKDIEKNKEAVNGYLSEICGTDSLDKMTPKQADFLVSNIIS